MPVPMASRYIAISCLRHWHPSLHVGVGFGVGIGVIFGIICCIITLTRGDGVASGASFGLRMASGFPPRS